MQKSEFSYKIQNMITDYEDTLKGYEKSLERAGELKKALEDYTKNTINKTFFDKYFLTKGEYRDFHEFSISDKQYNIGSHTFEIYLNGYEKLEINNRDRIHILEKLNEKIEFLKGWKDSATKKLENILATDEKAIEADIKAVYEKHGKPYAFKTILDTLYFS